MFYSPSFEDEANFVRYWLLPRRVATQLGLRLPCFILGIATPPPPWHGRRFVSAGAGPALQLLSPLGLRRVPHFLFEEDCIIKNKTCSGRERHTLHVYTFTSWFLLFGCEEDSRLWASRARKAAQACLCDV